MADEHFDIEAARRSYRLRARARREALRLQWEEARGQAEGAEKLIVERYHPTRVVQWGSVLRPEQFTDVSDIDIEVEGINDFSVWSSMEREVLAAAPSLKLRVHHERTARIFFWRTNTGSEVGLLKENRGKLVAAVEIKASKTICGADFSGLRSFRAGTSGGNPIGRGYRARAIRT